MAGAIDLLGSAGHAIGLAVAPRVWSPDAASAFASVAAGALSALVLVAIAAWGARGRPGLLPRLGALTAAIALAASVGGAVWASRAAVPVGLAAPFIAAPLWTSFALASASLVARRARSSRTAAAAAAMVLGVGATSWAIAGDWWRSRSLAWERALMLDPTSERANAAIVAPLEATRDAESLEALAQRCEASAGAAACESLRGRALYVRALAASERGAHADARDLALEAHRRGRGRDAALLAAASHIMEGDLDAAEALLWPLVRSDRSDADAYYNLGLIADRRGDYNRARESYLSALRAQPSHAAARYNVALLTHRFGVREEARHHAARFREAHPGDPRGASLTGVVGAP